MGLKPLGDRILVKRLEAEEKTKGGLYLPDTAKEKPQKGEIVEVGKGIIGDDGKVKPMQVKKGDKILFGKYSGTEVSSEGEDYIIMKEDEVLAVIE